MSLFSWLFKKKNMIEVKPKEESVEDIPVVEEQKPEEPVDSSVSNEEIDPESADSIDEYLNREYKIQIDIRSDHRFLSHKEIGASSAYFRVELFRREDENELYPNFRIYIKKLYKGVHLVPFGDLYLEKVFSKWEVLENDDYKMIIKSTLKTLYDNIVGYHLINSKLFTFKPSMIHKLDFSIPYPTEYDPNNCITGFVLINKSALDNYNSHYKGFIMRIIRLNLLKRY